MNNQRRALYLSHGGGPMPLLGDEGHEEMVGCLKNIAASIERPSAIIVVSAHWEQASPTITSGENPALIYDYNGFPKESYEIQYPCSGNPPLAKSMAEALNEAGLEAKLDSHRGFDHGLFVPLTIMYPEADIPCVQLSLVNRLDPAMHIKMGQAIQKISDPSLLLIGSGFSFHNMRAFITPETDETKTMNTSFEAWLLETCGDQTLTEDARKQRLIDWQSAPFARYCHPREEHLLPLHVCYGFAESACSQAYELQVLNKKASMYLWANN